MRTTRQSGPPASAGQNARYVTRWLPGAVLALGLVVVGFQPGCSASASTAVNSAGSARIHKDTTIVHQKCDTSAKGAEKIDVNRDGRPDIIIVKSGGHEVCRAVDLDFDGKIDMWVYRNPAGQVTRRETDYDRDGRIDEIAKYKHGVLAEKDRATTLSGKLDTWEYYKNGRLTSVERDSDGDGIIDQWWEYPPNGKPGCPLIRSDIDGDGRPDPDSTVDVCKDAGYVPPERTPAHQVTHPDFKSPGALPTELENKSAGSGSGAGSSGASMKDKKGGK